MLYDSLHIVRGKLTSLTGLFLVHFMHDNDT